MTKRKLIISWFFFFFFLFQNCTALECKAYFYDFSIINILSSWILLSPFNSQQIFFFNMHHPIISLTYFASNVYRFDPLLTFILISIQLFQCNFLPKNNKNEIMLCRLRNYTWWLEFRRVLFRSSKGSNR